MMHPEDSQRMFLEESARASLRWAYERPRPSHFCCVQRHRIPLSYYYIPDGSGWSPKRPSPRVWKEREAKYSRQARRDKKRVLGLHMRKMWQAQGYWSLEWTTCGSWVLGPPLGTWAQYPRSKKMRQREARQVKRAKRELAEAKKLRAPSGADCPECRGGANEWGHTLLCSHSMRVKEEVP